MFYENIIESSDFIRGKITETPKIGVVLGSGLGALVDVMEDKEVIPYSEIPHFPQSHVEGHAGNLVFGNIGSQRIAAMQGRFHYYEGFAMKEVTYPIYVMKQLGVEYLIVIVWALSSTGIAMKPTFAFSIFTGCPSRIADQPSE